MRSIFIPIVIIIGLMVLFVIVDRKEFNRHDSVRTVQSESTTSSRKPTVSVPETKSVTDVKPAVETKPVETKPVTETTSAETKTVAETKSTTVKPVETKPVAETKPVETKPVVETKPAETKPAEVKPTETKVVTETKPVSETKPIVAEKFVPSAIPVVTAEEAEKLNEEALIDLDNLMKAFSAKASDINVLEGQIKFISECPDPKAIDYPDCNLTISVVLNDDDKTELVLIVPCIRGSKKVLSPSIKDNAILEFRIKEDLEVSDEEKSIQTSDDISDIELEYFYVDYAVSIVQFSGKTKYIKKTTEKKEFDTQLILTEKDFSKRNEYMSGELNRLNKIIDSYSRADASVFKEKLLEFSKGIGEDNFPYVEIGAENDELKKVYPLDANVRPPHYLASACSFNTERMYSNAKVIASIRDFFRERGIHLIVIPVPQSVEAFIERFDLSKPLSTYNIDRVLLMKYLLEMDVEILDIEPYIEKNLSEQFYYHNHPQNNVHFRDGGNYYFAQHIFDHIKSYEYSSILQRNEFKGEVKWKEFNVVYDGKTFKPMKDAVIDSKDSPVSDHSPILLIGDSFTMGSLRRSLSQVFSTPISAISATSASTIMPRILQMREREIPQEAKVCFYVFYTSYLNGYFAPFVNKNSIQIFPDDSSQREFPSFDIEGKDLQEELSIDFSLDISSYESDAQSYTFFFYLTSTTNQNFVVTVNDSFKGTESTRGSGHGVVAVKLSKEVIRNPLNISVSTTPHSSGVPISQNKNLKLRIDKILFSKE